MEVRLEPQKITKGLYGNNGTRDSVLFPAMDGIFDTHGFLKKGLQLFPSTATATGKESSIIEEIAAQSRRGGIGYAEDKMPVG